MKDMDRMVADATGTRAINWVVTGTLDGLEFSIRYYGGSSAQAVSDFRRRYRNAENVSVERSLV